MAFPSSAIFATCSATFSETRPGAPPLRFERETLPRGFRQGKTFLVAPGGEWRGDRWGRDFAPCGGFDPLHPASPRPRVVAGNRDPWGGPGMTWMDPPRSLGCIRGTAVMECPRLPASVCLDAGEFDHLGPLFGFVGDQLSELSRRSRQRHAAEVSETGVHLRVVESRVDLLVECVDDRGRRGLGCADAEPIARLVVRDELSHGRDVRQRL